MKYIIDIPDEHESDFIAETPFGKRFCFPWRITDVAYSLPTHLHVEEYTDVNREEIENEVWNFVRFMSQGMDSSRRKECFGFDATLSAIKEMPYQEAKAKYDAWKKQKEQIHVGDEVELYENVKMVVTQVDHGTSIQGVEENVECYECVDCNAVKKTGRHFTEIEELLKKLGGEQG